MGLIRYKLGKLIELSYEVNSDGYYGIDAVRGINNMKEMMKSKADLNGRDLTKFQIVKPGYYVFNHRTSRNGSKFSITYNYDPEPHIFTEDYVVFHIKEDCSNILLKEWLYIYFCRPEFDRYVITNSWGSSTEFFNWSDICDIEISLPSIEQQREYVGVYLSLKKNLEAYQSKVDDLKIVCDGYIEDLRRKMKCEKIGGYINRYDIRNGKNGTTNVMGVSITKEFREPSSKVNRNELANYKVCHPGDIAFVQTTNNEKCFAYAYNNTNKDIVVSQVDEVFTTDKERLTPEYLSMFFNRKEFDRYARFHSWGSARETFTWEDVCQVQIPIPDIDIQRSIASIYKVYKERKAIAAQLKEQLNNLCPILIKGSLQ